MGIGRTRVGDREAGIVEAQSHGAGSRVVLHRGRRNVDTIARVDHLRRVGETLILITSRQTGHVQFCTGYAECRQR